MVKSTLIKGGWSGFGSLEVVDPPGKNLSGPRYRDIACNSGKYQVCFKDAVLENDIFLEKGDCYPFGGQTQDIAT